MGSIEQKYTKEQLHTMQRYPLSIKVGRTIAKIIEWVEYWGEERCAVSFSGGNDSRVLLYLARSIYPNIKAVFANTGLEHPQIREFVKTIPNVQTVVPLLNFMEVIRKFGYPIISKEIAETVERSRRAIDGLNSMGGGVTVRCTNWGKTS